MSRFAVSNDLSPALAVPPERFFGPISLTDIVRYQGASGDFHPAHHDAGCARSFGLDKPLSLGLLSAGYLATMATDWLGPSNVRSFKARFKAPVLVGESLKGSIKILDAKSSAGSLRIELELTATKATGEIAVIAWATFVVPEQQDVR
jgi:acyl dehydratase